MDPGNLWFPHWEAWFASTIIMQNTDRLKIGLGVTNPYTRHPVVVAQMAAGMQQLSSGRLALSIGKGIDRALQKMGIHQHDSAVAECITVLRSLIAGDRTSMDGQAFQINGMRLRTVPPDQAVPIYLAAMGPSSWEAAVRLADGVATIWSDRVVAIREQVLSGKNTAHRSAYPFFAFKGKFFSRV